MKKLIALVLAAACFACNKPATFEGTVEYAVNVENHNPEVDTAILSKIYGKAVTFYYKNGNIKQVNQFGSYSIYLANENLVYLQFRPDSVYYLKGSTAAEKMIALKQLDKKDTVLNKVCRSFYIQTTSPEVASPLFKNRKRTYFYSADYPVDAGALKNCNYNNFNRVYAEMKAIPLKIVDEFDRFSVTYEAVAVKPGVVNLKIFEVPNNLPKRFLH